METARKISHFSFIQSLAGSVWPRHTLRHAMRVWRHVRKTGGKQKKRKIGFVFKYDEYRGIVCLSIHFSSLLSQNIHSFIHSITSCCQYAYILVRGKSVEKQMREYLYTGDIEKFRFLCTKEAKSNNKSAVTCMDYVLRSQMLERCFLLLQEIHTQYIYLAF